MIFVAELAGAILRKEKTATRRLPSGNPRSPWRVEPSLRYPPGQEFAVQRGRGGPTVARAVVTDRGFEPLSHVLPADARREGFPTRDDFVAAWREINGSWDPAQKVHVIEFEIVNPKCHLCLGHGELPPSGALGSDWRSCYRCIGTGLNLNEAARQLLIELDVT